MKKILFAASEAVPFIKTGGLADVIGSLPKYFDKERYDVRVILPLYSCMDRALKEQLIYKTNFYMDLAWRKQYVGIFEMVYEGVTFYFIDNQYYFDVSFPYGNMAYDIEKFIFFDRAVLSALPVIGFQPDIIHCHDWQTGLVPVYLNDSFRQDLFFASVKSVMTIHNLKFQGRWDKDEVRDKAGLSHYYFTEDKLEAYGDANLLKGGLVYANKITTVSPTYAEEIKTSFFGEGLEGLLSARAHDLSGIVNGIDYEVYNPETDPRLVKNFNMNNFRKEKYKNKVALQKELGLVADKSKFMIGICSRLTDQKGLDLIQCVMEDIVQEDIQLVVLGTGAASYENMFRHYAWKYPEKVSANIYYSEDLAHKIYAACDAFLMPSLFEPCGLSQLMALRYGTIPIVRETGGLADTVEPLNEFTNEGVGFSFKNYNAHEMLGMIRYAMHIYYNKKRAFNRMIDRAMARDYSWHQSARAYERLYDGL
ncbi:MAG: glycogen synthase GlgA [Eubacteriales bacterium]|nr:glycogen synthase GlgA [Eubacteriales bacterium]